MTDQKLKLCLEQDMPDVPESFHLAMQSTLFQIVEEERQKAGDVGSVVPMPSKTRRSLKRRSAAMILVAALLLASIALAAAINPDVFTVLLGTWSAIPDDARDMIQHQLAEATVDGFHLSVQEAAYDGSSLYILYSIRDTTRSEPFGDSEEDINERHLTIEEYEEIGQWPVSWWTDRLWIDGEEIGMISGSSGDWLVGSEPGEILYYQLFRLDNDGIYLHGTVRITLPVGKTHSYTDLTQNADGSFAEPTEDVLTFELNTDDLPDVSHSAPNVKTTFPDGTVAWVSKADFTHLRLYMKLNYNVPESCLEDYKAQMGGEGYYDAEGNLLWPYSAMDVTDWVYDMTLVDENGQPVFDVDDSYLEGHGSLFAEFIFPYKEEYPSPMYIAPMQDGTADMSRAVLVRE